MGDVNIIVSKSIKKQEKDEIISTLFDKGCNSLYLLFNIYRNFDKNLFFYTSDFNFFASYSPKTMELYIFSLSFDSLVHFSKKIFPKLKLKISYVSGETSTIKLFYNLQPSLSAKLIFCEEYYFYKLELNDNTLLHLTRFLKIKESNPDLQFSIPLNRYALTRLIPLQMGYLSEEMNYPNHLLTPKIAKSKLVKSFKNYRIFFCEQSREIISKCEWNAYTNDILQIGGVYTIESFRKKGYSSFLLAQMLKYSFENLNYKYAVLFVRKDNKKAIQLYEKLGFHKNEHTIIWSILKTEYNRGN